MDDARRSPLLGLSVMWGYVFGLLLFAFVMTMLMPEAEGPSPWDPTAFAQGLVGLIANLKILDEMAALGLVKVADVGGGWLIVDLEAIAVSNRAFGWAPLFVSVASAVLCLLLRGIRLRLLARHVGVPSSTTGQLSAYFFGHGLNLFFPFGPGESGTVRMLTDHGAPAPAAAAAVFYGRIFEILAIAAFLVGGFIYLGWGGAVEAFIWTLVLITGVVSLTRPLGRAPGGRSGFGPLRQVWRAFRGDALVAEMRVLLRSPGLFVGVFLLSLTAFGLEVLAFWNIKQAFSAPLDDYVLMKDFAAVPFTVVIAVAALARVIPYTFAGFGVVELVMVVMFRVFGEGYLGGTTVAILCALLLNTVTLVLFLMATWLNRCPSILDTWQAFFDQSAARASDTTV
jgi:uncharacterized membrane protein YbhN (UPF0104 family)